MNDYRDDHKTSEILETEVRRFTKALSVPLSVYPSVILVWKSFSCPSDLMVEIMAINPQLKFYICFQETRTGRD